MLITSTKEEFVKNCTKTYIQKVIRDLEHLSDVDKKDLADYKEVLLEEQEAQKELEVKVPHHLKDLVTNFQLDDWIDNAIKAKYKWKQNENYVLDENKIVPVDSSNTGILQKNMHWSNGLHQFLQIKHGAKINPESFSTNFISNVTYFKRYGHNIYGLTGTLGCNEEKGLLEKTYGLDSIIIPPFKVKRYKELTSIITYDKESWHENIIKTSLNKLENQRAILIITKYIKDAEELYNKFTNDFHYDKSKIRIYRTEKDSNQVEREVVPGDLIIATNIAGRGTDIRPDNSNSINQHGGLHVINTVLAKNERVEQQNFGRTSRTGNNGTGQYILYQRYNTSLQELKEARYQKEKQEIKIANEEIKKVLAKDDAFAKFCQLLDHLFAGRSNLNAIEKIKVRSVEERFGHWLRKQEKICEKEKTCLANEIVKEFEKFSEEIETDHSNGKLISNPYFHVKIGNSLLKSAMYKTSEIRQEAAEEAIKEFEKAIQLDPYFQANAYYGMGFAKIAAYGENYKNEKTNEAVNDFKKAKEIIENHLEPMLQIIQQASSSEALSEQVVHKLNLYNIQKNAIESAIGGKNVDLEIKALEKQKNEQTDLKSIEDINDYIKYLKENKTLLEKGVIGKAKNEEKGIKIELLPFKESLPEDQDLDNYLEEIREHKNNGFLGIFKVIEITPIPWLSVIGMALIGIAQIIGGAALTVFTLGGGASIGAGLISEGIGDLITTVKDGIIGRSISWAAWGIQKAISLTVSLVCAGLKAIKDVAKVAVSGIKQAVSVGTNAVTGVVKEGWKLAAKKLGTELGKQVGKELVKTIADYGVDKLLIPKIEETIKEKVENKITEYLKNNDKVKEMLELDGQKRDSYYQSQIKQKAMSILYPKSQIESPLLTIAKGIASGIANNKIAGLGAVLQAKEVIEALSELDTFVPDFINKLEDAINALHKEINNRETVQQSRVINTLESLSTDSDIESWDSDLDDDLEFEGGEVRVEQVGLTTTIQSPESLIYEISKKITGKMSSIIKNKIITPATNKLITYGFNKLTEDYETALNKQIGNYKAHRRIQFMQSGDRNNRVPANFKEWRDEDARRKGLEKANDTIENLKKGGEAGLMHLGALSDTTDRPIEVYNDNGELQYVIGRDKKTDPLKVEYHKNSDGSGHWTLPGGKDPEVSSGKNNCLFDLIAFQTKNIKSGEKLREETFMHMEKNKEWLAYQAADIIRLEAYSDALKMGGADISVKTKILNEARAELSKKQTEIEKKREELKKCTTEEEKKNKEEEISKLETEKEEIKERLDSRSNAFKEEKKRREEEIHYQFQLTDTLCEIKGSNGKTDDPMKKDQAEKIKELIHNKKDHIILDRVGGVKQIVTDDFHFDVEEKGNYFQVEVQHRKGNKSTIASVKYPKEAVNSPSLKDKVLSQIISAIDQSVYSKKCCEKTLSFDSKKKAAGIASILNNRETKIDYWLDYDSIGLDNLLRVRLQSLLYTSTPVNIKAFNSRNIDIHDYNMLKCQLSVLFKGINQIYSNDYKIQFILIPILIPQSCYLNHWVGVFLHKKNIKFEINYLDSENQPIDEKLKQEFISRLQDMYPDYGINYSQVKLETQKYNNCGPELIENFIDYLTNTRATQENAVYLHSLLYENSLLDPSISWLQIQQNNKLIGLLSQRMPVNEIGYDEGLHSISKNLLFSKQQDNDLRTCYTEDMEMPEEVGLAVKQKMRLYTS